MDLDLGLGDTFGEFGEEFFSTPKLGVNQDPAHNSSRDQNSIYNQQKNFNTA
jgi:hypothetical protein